MHPPAIVLYKYSAFEEGCQVAIHQRPINGKWEASKTPHSLQNCDLPIAAYPLVTAPTASAEMGKARGIIHPNNPTSRGELKRVARPAAGIWWPAARKPTAEVGVLGRPLRATEQTVVSARLTRYRSDQSILLPKHEQDPAHLAHVR